MIFLISQLAIAQQPNILFIVADDVGYNTTSVYNPTGIYTPELETLAATGTVLTQGYVTAATCAPSRAAIHTGRYQQRFGFEFNPGPPDLDRNRGLDPGELTIADYLRAEGYDTSLVGKWHLGTLEEHYPTNRGFNYYWGPLAGSTSYIHPDNPYVVNARTTDSIFWEETDTGLQPTVFVGSYPQPRSSPKDFIYEGVWPPTKVDNEDQYLTIEITKEAVNNIQTLQEPWFLNVSYTAAHSPLQAMERLTPTDSRPEQERVFEGMIKHLDEGVGYLLDELDNQGLTNNTIVVFISDNGCADAHGVCDACNIVRGGKGCQLEGGVRIPFVVRWPDSQLLQQYDNPVSSLDLLPTFLAAAGGSIPPNTDGVDLFPFLTGFDPSSPHDYLFWRKGEQYAVLGGDYKLRTHPQATQLHELSTDQLENIDVSNQYPGIVQDLQTAYTQWEATITAPLWPSKLDGWYEQCGELIPMNP